jgi:hypothetical protein
MDRLRFEMSCFIFIKIYVVAIKLSFINEVYVLPA